MKTATKVLTYILVVLLLLGIVGGVAYFALRSQGVTFYVEYGGKQYLANTDGANIYLRPNMTHEFAVKSLTGEDVNFDVKVMSSGANNFPFVIGSEKWWLWNDDEASDDYSEVFGLQKNAEGFSLTLSEIYTVEQAVEAKFGSDIELQDNYEINPDLYYFVISVAVGDGAVDLCFNFYTHIDGIVLDPPQIIF